MSGALPPNGLGPLQSRRAVRDQKPTIVQPNLEYKVGVSEMSITRDTVVAGGITRHVSGGQAATQYLGTWVRERRLGSGGYGVVYLEHNPEARLYRAVKRLEGGNTDQHDREIAQMIKVIKYSELFVRFYCWYCDSAYNMYIAMEYHDLGDLKRLVNESGPFTETIAKGIAQQVLRGIFVLHGLEIAHRDIKPENILVVSINPIKIKIADFGQAKLVKGSYNSKTGTDGWTAPEVAGQYYDGLSADMWSIGCVVYYLLTSLNPFLGYDGESKENIAKFTFHFWPRLHQYNFQEYSDILDYSDNPKPGGKAKLGDQILLKGVGNIANAFLKNLIVRDRSQRMSAHRALKHPWICQTTPLQAALEDGDFQLASLLALHDVRYQRKWEGEPSPSVALIVLRVAAASGHFDLVKWALEKMPSKYEFTHNIPLWNLKPALVGAAISGSLPIVMLLLAELGCAEMSPYIVMEACKAALKGGHHQVVYVIWPLVSKRDRVWDDDLTQHAARYGNSTILDVAHSHWIIHKGPNRWMELQIINHGNPSSAYAHHYPRMLEHASRYGNIENVKWLLRMRPPLVTGIPDNVLLRAIEGGHCNILILLLQEYHLPSEAQLLTEALNDASHYGHMEIVKCLVERGVIPSAKAVARAVANKNSTIFRYLIGVLLAKFKQDSRRVAQYITADAMPHCSVGTLDWLCTKLRVPIQGNMVEHAGHAARFGSTETVKWFIVFSNQSRNADAVGVMRAAFVGASERGHLDIVTHLCKMETNARLLGSWVGAAEGGHISILDQLRLTNPTPRQSTLNRALLAAVKVNRLGAVLWLLCAGASPSDGHGGIVKPKCQQTIQELLDDFGYGL